MVSQSTKEKATEEKARDLPEGTECFRDRFLEDPKNHLYFPADKAGWPWASHCPSFSFVNQES